jgi:hypothetical protein
MHQSTPKNILLWNKELKRHSHLTYFCGNKLSHNNNIMPNNFQIKNEFQGTRLKRLNKTTRQNKITVTDFGIKYLISSIL